MLYGEFLRISSTDKSGFRPASVGSTAATWPFASHVCMSIQAGGRRGGGGGGLGTIPALNNVVKVDQRKKQERE